MELIDKHAANLGIAPLCDALDVPRASYYRWKMPVHGPHRPRPSPRALSPDEREGICELMHAPRFVDCAPAEIVATLLDEGIYKCSERTMYRILAQNGAISFAIRPTPSPSCWPRDRTSCGRGTSPSCSARQRGPTSTYT